MRGVMKVLCAGLLPGLIVTACNQTEAPPAGDGRAPSAAAETTTTTQTFSWDGSDGTIVCPSSSGCPKETREGSATEIEYAGVMFTAPNVVGIPRYAGPPPIVCVAGEPKEHDQCPDGDFHARIWPKRDHQIVCTPDDNEGPCAAAPGYAFFCSRVGQQGPDPYCLGVSTKIPKEETDGTQAATTGS